MKLKKTITDDQRISVAVIMLIILTVSSGNWMLLYCLHSYLMIIKAVSKMMLPLIPGCPFFSTFILNTTEKASSPQALSLSIWPTFNIKLIWCSGHFVHVGYEWFQINNYIKVSINVYHFVSIVRFFLDLTTWNGTVVLNMIFIWNFHNICYHQIIAYSLILFICF